MAERKKKRLWIPFINNSGDHYWLDENGESGNDDSGFSGWHHHENHNNQEDNPSQNRNKRNPNTGIKKPKRGLFR